MVVDSCLLSISEGRVAASGVPGVHGLAHEPVEVHLQVGVAALRVYGGLRRIGCILPVQAEEGLVVVGNAVPVGVGHLVKLGVGGGIDRPAVHPGLIRDVGLGVDETLLGKVGDVLYSYDDVFGE